MDVSIEVVDPRDEDRLHTWWSVGREVSRERPYDPWPAWAVSRVALPEPSAERDLVFLLLTVGSEPAATALLVLPQQANTHLAAGEIAVPAGHRRRGLGTRLLADLEERALAAGRRTLVMDAWSVPGQDSDGTAFAAARGLETANRDGVKVLDLHAAPATWGPLREEVAAHQGGYRVVAFEHEIPEAHLVGTGRLLSTFFSQIPLGTLDLEDSEWTPERIRADEQRARRIGRLDYCALALSGQGDVVAFTNAAVDLADPVRASVGATIVAPEHRGHRLGLAVKLAGHDLLRTTHPGCRDVVTGNADSNAAMNAINERLGYRLVETCHELQKRLA